MQSDTAKTPRTERHANKFVDHGIKDTRLSIIHSSMSTGNSNNGQPPRNNEVMTSAQAPVATLLLPPPPPPPAPVAVYAHETSQVTSTTDRDGTKVTVGDRVLILQSRWNTYRLQGSVGKLSGVWRIGKTQFVLAKMETASANDEVVRLNRNNNSFPIVNDQKIDEILIRRNNVLFNVSHVALCEQFTNISMRERTVEDIDALEAASTTTAGKRPREPADGGSDADPNGKRPVVREELDADAAAKTWLKIRLDDGSIRSVTTECCYVGRGEENQLNVGSCFVSKQQCYLRKDPSPDNLAILVDTSRKGTLVNDVPVINNQCFLKHRDKVGVGRDGTYTSYFFEVLDPTLPNPYN